MQIGVHTPLRAAASLFLQTCAGKPTLDATLHLLMQRDDVAKNSFKAARVALEMLEVNTAPTRSMDWHTPVTVRKLQSLVHMCVWLVLSCMGP